MSGVVKSVGLRERRRRQTSLEIHRAALELASERGFDNVTVEEIATAAGVSPRTFFNYFTTKESAIVHAPLDITAEQAAEFVASKRTRHSEILDDAIAVISAGLAESPPSRQQMADLRTVALNSVAVSSAVLAEFDAFQRRLAVLIAQRTGAEPDDDIPVLIASLALTVVRVGMDRWATIESEKSDSPVPHVQHAARLVQGFFSAPGR
ncbi:TetR family transcriptional regulator [Mycolicibacterium sp. 624]|uniref:TetR family transcriptional regulator n=1 Tax=Mycolicibacterium sp. 624 TaxID=3156314 RepID=UPI003396EBC1